MRQGGLGTLALAFAVLAGTLGSVASADMMSGRRVVPRNPVQRLIQSVNPAPPSSSSSSSSSASSLGTVWPWGSSASSSSSSASSTPQAAAPAQTVGAQIAAALSSRTPASLGGSPASGDSPSVSFGSNKSQAPAGGGRQAVEFDDNQPKNKQASPPPPRNQGGASNPPSPPSGGGKKKAQAFDRWWPMCIFADPAAGDVNGAIRKLVAMAASCRVNLVVFPFYISSNYPSDPAALNQAAKAKCNATDGFRKFGANRASVATIVSRSGIANQMCGCSPGGTPDICGEFGFSPGDGIEARLKNTCRFGGVAKSGEAAAAIIGPDQVNAASLAAVAQGQAQMSFPPGMGAGNGVGDIDEGNATAGSQPEEGWQQPGCDQMRATAFPNEGKWKYNADQEKYLMMPKNDQRLVDLMDERPIFHAPNGAPAQGPASGRSSGGGGGGTGTGGAVSTFGSAGGGGMPFAGGGDASPTSASPAAGHQKPASGSIAGAGSGKRGALRRAGRTGRGGASGVYAADGSSGGAGPDDGNGSPDSGGEAASDPVVSRPGAAGDLGSGSGKARPTVGFDDSAPRGGLERWDSAIDGNGKGGGLSGAQSGAAGGVFGSGSGSGIGGSIGLGRPGKKDSLDADFFKKKKKKKEDSDERGKRGTNRPSPQVY